MPARTEVGRHFDRILAAWLPGEAQEHGARSSRQHAELDRAYRAERLASQASRGPFVYAVLLFFSLYATTLEFLSYPERRAVMLVAFAGYASTCLGAIALLRRHPKRTLVISVIANNLLIAFTAGYYAPTHAAAEACAMTIVLFLAALPLINGADARLQALSCLGALIAYPLALLAGAKPSIPVSYGLTAVAGATGVTVLGAHLLDRQRRAAFLGREALRSREEELRRVLERYRALYENNPVMYFTVADDGTVRSVNGFGAEQLGYEVEELVGSSVLSVFSPEDRGEIRRQLDRCIERIGDVAHWECRKNRKDGTVLWVRESARAMREGNGRIVILIVCEDATERKHAEEAARRHQADLAHVGRVSLMGEMAAGLAHELNQPLAAIVNFSRGCERRLKAGAPPDAEMMNALEQVSTQALRAGEIIRRLRTFIRKEEPALAWVDLNVLARNVAEFADSDGRQQGIRIDLALAPRVPKIYADSIQIEQVILNLVRNGFDAMEGGASPEKTLSIRTEEAANGHVEMAISDTGHGLGSELIDRVFDPFFSTKSNGLGLGLSISRSIVEAHGGRLWAEPNPNGGSTFRFSLAVTGAGGARH